MVDLLLIALIFVAILFPFVVVPEILERAGYDPKSRFVRIVVWSCFLIFVIAFAMLWEYYRLHPGEFP